MVFQNRSSCLALWFAGDAVHFGGWRVEGEGWLFGSDDDADDGVGFGDGAEAAGDAGRDADEVAVAQDTAGFLGAVFDIVDTEFHFAFEDEEDLFDVGVGVLGADASGGEHHVGEGEVFCLKDVVVVGVVTGGAGSDVADLSAAELIAHFGLELGGVEVDDSAFAGGD